MSRRHLTERELEIVALVAAGLTSKQIGRTLKLSLWTVQTHRRNIMQKLRVKNGISMVNVAVRRGLLDDHQRK